MAQIASGLQGQVTKDNYGGSMGIAPLYPGFDEGGGWRFDDIDLLMIDYITDAEAAAAVLPAEASLVAIPSAPGQSAVKFVWAHYRRCTLGPYREAFQTIPCLYDNNLYLYVPQIWVDTDAAMASGREVAGFPKKLADIEINFLGNTWQGYIDRPRGQRIASFTFETTDELLSIPLPADRTPAFPSPYNVALPLPEPTGQPQALPFSTLTMRLIPYPPNPGADTNTNPWALAQLNSTLWTLDTGTLWGGDATLAFHPSEQDPVADLPVNAILDAMLIRGDMKAAQSLPLVDL
jgi:acetoacetate decarboxylase